MKKEINFSKGVRAKYYERYHAGTNIVMLDPDVAKVFRNATSVNAALRKLIVIAEKTVRS